MQSILIQSKNPLFTMPDKRTIHPVLEYSQIKETTICHQDLKPGKIHSLYLAINDNFFPLCKSALKFRAFHTSLKSPCFWFSHKIVRLKSIFFCTWKRERTLQFASLDHLLKYRARSSHIHYLPKLCKWGYAGDREALVMAFSSFRVWIPPPQSVLMAVWGSLLAFKIS